MIDPPSLVVCLAKDLRSGAWQICVTAGSAHSGLVVSVVGIGCNNFGRKMDEAQTRLVVDAALDHGVNLFDTADIYGTGASETLLGKALQGRRDDVVIATKFGMDMEGANGVDRGARGSRRYIVRAVEASLRRLGTDYIDLYQMHAPDPATPIDETLSALDDLVRAGKVRYLGNSNFAGWQIADADWTARSTDLDSVRQRPERIQLAQARAWRPRCCPACGRFGLGMLPFFPLASGLLTGKYRRDAEPPAGSRLSEARVAHRLAGADWTTIEALEAFAAERGITMLDVAIGGLAAQPAVSSVIAGATTPEQVARQRRRGSVDPVRGRPGPACAPYGLTAPTPLAGPIDQGGLAASAMGRRLRRRSRRSPCR